ncbi:MAG: L-threonylcarbamoyladenylate synthase [Magnetococcus sp. YQC-3]
MTVLSEDCQKIMVANLENEAEDLLQRASRALADGQIIAHPTETVFGLAVDPFNPRALQHLLQLKGRAANKGFILLIPDEYWLNSLVEPPSPLAKRLIHHFWPGPLTLLLPARPGLPITVTGGSGLLAVRHSSSPLVAALLRLWQKPLVSTSANPTGHPPARSATEVQQYWRTAVAVILTGPGSTDSQPSTLLQVVADRVRLLREGSLTMAQLQTKIPEILDKLENEHPACK